MRDQVARWLFVKRTMLSVAYSNRAVDRAFGGIGSEPRRLISPQYAIIGGAALLTAIVVSAMVSGVPKMREPDRRLQVPSAALTLSSKYMPLVSNGRSTDPGTAGPADPATPAPEPDYALAVDKSRKVLFVLSEEHDHYRIIRKFDISLGRIVGTKEKAGDMRTPSGIYKIVEIKDRESLPAYYGPRAFVTDYPNRFDQANGRTGGGIWLHGSGQGARTRNTHGCVVLDDDNLMSLGTWVRVNTPVAIFPDGFHLPVQEDRIEKKYLSIDFFYRDTLHASNG